MSMTGFPLIPKILFVCMLACGFVYNFLLWRMVSEVNKHLKDADKFSHLIWYPGKPGRVRKEHKTLFPDSRLPFLMNFFIGLGAIFFAATFITFMGSFLLK